MKKQLKSFKFYFSQVNQECVKVKAFSILNALQKAEKDWMSRNKHPITISAESLESGFWKNALI